MRFRIVLHYPIKGTRIKVKIRERKRLVFTDKKSLELSRLALGHFWYRRRDSNSQGHKPGGF